MGCEGGCGFPRLREGSDHLRRPSQPAAAALRRGRLGGLLPEGLEPPGAAGGGRGAGRRGSAGLGAQPGRSLGGCLEKADGSGL